jgi:AraC-like DNA-binding protein
VPNPLISGVLNPVLGRQDPVSGLWIGQNFQGPAMPTFPIPVFVACIVGFAALRLWYQQGRMSLMVMALLLCAGQSLVIALNQHYGIAGMRLVQPIVAAFLPPMAWIAHQGRVTRADLLHLVGPVLAIAALIVAPLFIDVLLPGMFALYGGGIIYNARGGGDSQPDTLLSSGDIPSQIWQVIGAALMASALSDVLIVASQIAGYPGAKPWIVSLFSVGNLALIGVLSLSPHLQRVPDIPRESAQPPQAPDAELWDRIQRYMRDQRPYLDPDLTLTRLSRKLGIPAKTLSATINAATGGNVSRYINQSRIHAAQDLMQSGESVTNAIFASGFNTKSNFNREFQLVVVTRPSAWLKQGRGP